MKRTFHSRQESAPSGGAIARTWSMSRLGISPYATVVRHAPLDHTTSPPRCLAAPALLGTTRDAWRGIIAAHAASARHSCLLHLYSGHAWLRVFGRMLGAATPSGQPIRPSGAGASHLLRWMRAAERTRERV